MTKPHDSLRNEMMNNALQVDVLWRIMELPINIHIFPGIALRWANGELLNAAEDGLIDPIENNESV